MKRVWIVVVSLLFVMGCAATQTADKQAQEVFFDEGVVENIQPGQTSHEELTAWIGKPYTTIPLEGDGEQYVFMHTYERQLIVTINDETVTGWEWSEQYATPAPVAGQKAGPRKSSGHGW